MCDYFSQLTRYTHADFADDDSVNSVQLAEGNKKNLQMAAIAHHFVDKKTNLIGR